MRDQKRDYQPAEFVAKLSSELMVGIQTQVKSKISNARTSSQFARLVENNHPPLPYGHTPVNHYPCTSMYLSTGSSKPIICPS